MGFDKCVRVGWAFVRRVSADLLQSWSPFRGALEGAERDGGAEQKGGEEGCVREPVRERSGPVNSLPNARQGAGDLVRKLVGAAAIFWLAVTGLAFAYSDKQMGVMSHLGQAIAGTKICSQLEISEGEVAVMITAYNVDLGDPTVPAVIRSKVDETISAWAGKGEGLACAGALILYGPSGSSVPGLLRIKD
ncbi:MAG: hypothetical protein E5Y89_02130 [Mesorhizobium sp.]|nr:MAG: hypothetical protein E5Y89_02130 [Mesorhizobium sp.]